MSIDEWQRFVLDTERANYKTGDANGNVQSGILGVIAKYTDRSILNI